MSCTTPANIAISTVIKLIIKPHTFVRIFYYLQLNILLRLIIFDAQRKLTVATCTQYGPHAYFIFFLARDVIYTSRAYAMMQVHLSVTEVHWRIIANLGFNF